MESIVLIIDSLITGGAETTNIRLADMFLEAGFDVHIISIKDNKELHISKNIKVDTLAYKKRKKLFNNKYYSKLLENKLNQIKNKKLILGSLGLSHKLMNIIDKKFNFYYVLHGTTTKAKLDTKKGLSRLIKKNELENLYNNKNIICVSKGVEKDILSLNIKPKTIQTIYNPFNFTYIKELSEKNINIQLPEKYIVHVGRFAKVKKHDILIQAFSLLKDKTLKLVLVGDGEERKNIEELIKKLGLEKKIILLGFLENPYPIIKKAKLLVLSSENEGFGNVLIEAMILNTNVVSTNAPTGPSEILIDSLSENLAEVNNYKDLQMKINHALSNMNIINYPISQYKEEVIQKEYFNLFE